MSLSATTLLTVGMIVTLPNGHWASCNVEKASIGEPLTLFCNHGQPLCSSGIYLWYNVTGAESLLPSTTRELTVSEKVTTVGEVGGHNYTCQCNGTTENEDCFLIWVRPQVIFTILPPVAKLNSSTSIVCTAESYPPANNVSFFHLFHDQRITSTQSASVGTGVEYHIAHVNKSHEGEYKCFVSIDGYSQGLQSNTVTKTLTVYDPPRIKRIQNFTLYSEPHGEKFALLECEVECKEAKLEVWVNWTTWSKAVVDQKRCVCGAAEHTVVFFLVIHNVTKEDVGLYTCQLFSTYSSNKAEDQRTAHIQIADTEICGGMSEIPTSEGATTKTEEENCARTGTIVGVVTMVVTSIFWIILCFVVYISRRRCSQSVHPEKGYDTDTMSQGNTRQPAHSVSPPILQTYTLEFDSNSTDSGSANQMVPTSQTSTPELAPPNQTSAQGHLAITNPVAAGSKEIPSGSTENQDSIFSNDINGDNGGNSVANTKSKEEESHLRKRSPTSSTSN